MANNYKEQNPDVVSIIDNALNSSAKNNNKSVKKTDRVKNTDDKESYQPVQTVFIKDDDDVLMTHRHNSNNNQKNDDINTSTPRDNEGRIHLTTQKDNEYDMQAKGPNEKKMILRNKINLKTNLRGKLQNFLIIVKDKNLRKITLFNLVITPVRFIFRHMDATFPKYLDREFPLDPTLFGRMMVSHVSNVTRVVLRFLGKTKKIFNYHHNVIFIIFYFLK